MLKKIKTITVCPLYKFRGPETKRISMKKYFRQFLFVVVLIVPSISSAEDFVIEDIRVDGLQRVSASSVFSVFPLDVGDDVGPNDMAAAMRVLFKTGNFQDIKLVREGDVLVIQVRERPSISEINIDGNETIETESLLEGLSQAGLSVGSVFKRSTLDRVKLELERQYVAQGRYGAKVETNIKPLPRNRIMLDINISEGEVASIVGIEIIGNEAFSDEDLADELKLKETNMLSFFTDDDQYSREKLSGDLEVLHSYYMDRGYIGFHVESQVTVTPDKSKVYINLNLSEGDKFTVGEVKLSGDFDVPEEELKKLLVVQEGQTFSRQLVTLTSELITKRLGNDGYTFANVNGVPDVDKASKTVDITFFVDPGSRVYVNRINFKGNTKTRDSVLRREMRQMESEWASGEDIEQSKVRLERLGYFKTVDVQTPRVAGVSDQIDVEYTVEEQASGSLGASLGYQQGTGFVFGANVSQTNFLGTGNRVSFSLNHSDIRDNYSFSFLDPYFTLDGVSRGFSVFYRKTNYDDLSDFSNWATNVFGGNVTFGYPISDTDRLNYSLGYENTEVLASSSSPQEAWNLVNYDTVSGGTQSAREDAFIVSGGWSSNTLNRGVFATKGTSQNLTLEVAIPGSNLEYYKMYYTGQIYVPLGKSWVFHARTTLGYGDGYAGTGDLPFYDYYYAGGFGTIRGFEERTLGPRATPNSEEIAAAYDAGFANGGGVAGGTAAVNNLRSGMDAIGGNLLTVGSLELIFPIPLLKDKRAFRTLFFIDGGNVFATKKDTDNQYIEAFSPENMRYSVGVGFSWVTAIGPLTFCLAKALNTQDGDKTQAFQFTLGQPL